VITSRRNECSRPAKPAPGAGILTIVGLAVAVAALVVFGSQGTIVWPLALAMLAGKASGGYFGARYAVKAGDAKIRFLLVIVALAAAIDLLIE
jgi:uncharacterized protein